MKNTSTNKYLLTIAAAAFLLIPGATADPIALLDVSSPDVASTEADGVKEFLRCLLTTNPVVGVPVTDQIVRCLVVSGIGNFVTCMGSIPLPVFPDLVGQVKECKDRLL